MMDMLWHVITRAYHSLPYLFFPLLVMCIPLSFACKQRHPITTTDHLAFAVANDLLPQDPQTCKDYGFERAFTAENWSKLLGLYIGLVRHLGIPPKTINDWRVRGVLVEEIKAAYYKIPAEFRGSYFPWFLQNQHILDPFAVIVSQSNDEGDAMAIVLRAWRFTGGAETDSPADIRARIASMPQDRQSCHLFYTMLLSKVHPVPFDDFWIPFGFCSCACKEEEMYLGEHYQALITKCTFDEFCNAFRSARIPDLFRKNGINVDLRYLADVLQNHRMRKSVWDLKQSVIQTDGQNSENRIAISAVVDYGFMNCKKDAEIRALKKIYRTFFERRDANPLALHDAAIRGNIFGYLGILMKLDKKKKRLMKNPYPLYALQ
ncbi:hypothetical protein F4604DRAFT_1630266 [Suillus subluteus]|nr:hypothetical protein F4604DRAFT_1630266 [Suillus subluteus]